MNHLTPIRRAGRAFAISTLTTAIAVFGSGQAMAAPAPTCVKVDGTGRSVLVTNRCGSTQRLKVIFAFGQDSACFTLGNNRSVRVTSGSLARFDGINLC